MIHFNKYPLPAQFSDAIQSIWSIHFNEEPTRIPVIPDAYPDLLIPLEGEIWVEQSEINHSIQTPCIIGQQNGIAFLSAFEKSTFLSIKLYPWLLSSILKDKAILAKNRFISADLIFSYRQMQVLGELKESFQTAKLSNQLYTNVLPMFQQFLAQGKPRIKPIAVYSIQQYFAALGQLTSNDLASKLNCSRRYLELIFKEYIGISPKQYARIIRTKKASILLSNATKNKLNLSNISYDMGYYDLSHFNKDFKAITQSSPRQFLGNLEKHVLYQHESYLGQWGYS